MISNSSFLHSSPHPLGVVKNAELGRFVQILCLGYHISQQKDTNRLIPVRFCVMATSIPCEIIVSNAEQILCVKRSRLKCSTLSMILFLHAKLEYDCRLTYTQTHSMGSEVCQNDYKMWTKS